MSNNLFRVSNKAAAVTTATAGRMSEKMALSGSHKIEMISAHHHNRLKIEHGAPDTYIARPTSQGRRSVLNKAIGITSGFSTPISVRWNHTDVRAPRSLESQFKKSMQDPTVPTRDSEAMRKTQLYAAYAVGASLGLYYAKSAAWFIAGQRKLSRECFVAGKTEVKMSEVPEGTTKTFKWRSKPIFVRHRTDAEIATEEAVPMSELRHPQQDGDRVKDKKWLVVLGVCTHLGCVPISNKGDYNGWYCPCHGSHYDASGRIRKGPAPLNLEIPDYDFHDDDTIIIGG